MCGLKWCGPKPAFSFANVNPSNYAKVLFLRATYLQE